MLSAQVKEFLDIGKEALKLPVRNYKDLVTKDAVREATYQWLKEHDILAYVYIEYSWYNKAIDSIGIHNSILTLNKNNSGWSNKIIVGKPYVGADWEIRSHVATTDPKFLEPNQKIFLEFVKEMMNYLYL